ncbi:MAG TPA: efflux RND transporter periplasmic adaptor subunit [Acidobacterium sp.]|uniref:Heavy metal efflux transporter, RND family, MFP subunit n=2 Tax=Acidobacteriaceae TaxID=204434 RepID=C1F6K1_ACIC5|nr:heavy metal efflux transporter, RND family, MFP subunit [Acidobacterium capsulatum ATCC 51196]HCT60889.1 efflux RND transporter periplasmic adaptor subunit [Acidobacterium sp.]
MMKQSRSVSNVFQTAGVRRRMFHWQGYCLMAAAVGAMSLGLAGCGHKSNAETSTGKTQVIEQSSDGSVITLDPSVAKHFQLAQTRAIDMPDKFSAPGVIAPDVSRTVSVFSLANGFAVKVPAQLGEQVTKGQVLAVVDSPDLAKAISVYQTAKAQLDLSGKELSREQGLYRHGAAPRKALEQAQFAEQHAQIDEQSAAREIEILGGSLESPSPFVTVRSPISGTIIEQKISRGEAVENSYLFQVADLSRVWALCSLYENDLSRVQVGDAAQVEVSAYPDLKLQGKVSNISHILDPATRTSQVRVVLDNPQGLLNPGMFVTAGFTSVRKSPQVLVPVTALFQLHDQFWVFEPVKPGVFRRVPVTVGAVVSPGWQVVTAGLQAHQSVVANSLGFSAAASLEN